jgi:CubicO group peptidase (beta-lactamase class C family)
MCGVRVLGLRARWLIAVAAAVGVALPGIVVPGSAAALPAEQDVHDPGADPWTPVPRNEVAERCGLDPDMLLAADAALASSPYTVVRYGQLCWTGGYPTGTSQPYSVWSVTKTFGAILVGMVAARSSLEDTDLVTRWLDENELGDVNPQATIAHVLAMTATEEDLSHGAKGPWSYDTFGDREIDLLLQVVDRVIDEEGASFPGVTDAVEFAQQEIFDRLGMTSTTWAGDTIAGGMISSPEDLARLGLLILRRGRWDGEQLLDERYVYRMSHPAFEDSNTGYGYLTYINAHSNWAYSTGTSDLRCAPFGTWSSYPHAPFFEAPDDNDGSPFGDEVYDVGVVYAFGAGGQRIAVHRALDLVITVRDSVVSTDEEDPGTFEGHKSVWAEIRPALVEHDPTFAGDEEAFCQAYQRSAHAPDLLDPWSEDASGPAPADLSSPVSPKPDGEAGEDLEDREDDEGSEAHPSSEGARGPTLPATGPGVPGVLVALAAFVLMGLLRRHGSS